MYYYILVKGVSTSCGYWLVPVIAWSGCIIHIYINARMNEQCGVDQLCLVVQRIMAVITIYVNVQHFHTSIRGVLSVNR